MVYTELRSIARRLLRNERASLTLESVDLVHEAYFRLADQKRTDWRDRAHFLAVAAGIMRRLLIDHARRRGARKRGRSWQRIDVSETLFCAPEAPFDILDVEKALTRLAAIDERMAQVAELHIFAGLESRDVAEVLRVSRRTAERDWTGARAFLSAELHSGRNS